MSEEFGLQWNLKWAQGTIIGYGRNRIELNRAKGMLRRAMEIIGKDKLSAIFKNVEESPIHLSTLPHKEKVKKLKLLRKELGLRVE